MSYEGRYERAARRALAQQLKEQAKLDESARARLAVQAHENVLDVLLSVHREVGESWDWKKLASALPPAPPVATNWTEMRTRQDYLIKPEAEQEDREARIAAAKSSDSEAYRISRQAHQLAYSKWEEMRAIASRVLAGEKKAYTEVLAKYCPLSELSGLGTELDFTVHSRTQIECAVTVKGTRIIPEEAKTLTSSGKLSVKPMSRTRFHEIYQDYVCGCVLRIAREVFAALPVERVVVTASTAIFDAASGLTSDKPVLSCSIARGEIAHFEWDTIDASDAVDSLTHRGDFKASRKDGAFLPIEPLTASQETSTVPGTSAIAGLRNQVSELRKILQTETRALVGLASP